MAVSLFCERAVVCIFIALIIFFAPPSLLLRESLSLSLLSLFALAVDISADDCPSSSPKFSPPGVLLGAVTLPELTVSKLIQMSRGLPLGEVSIEEFEYQRFQYWVTSGISFSVLVFLFFVLKRQHNNACPVHSCFNWCSRFCFSWIALCAGVLSVSFAVKSPDGWYAVLMLLWVLCHGFAAVKLTENVFHTFPACASIGEALLVTAGIVIYFGDLLAHTASKVQEYGHLMSSKLYSMPYKILRSQISTIIQGLILGLLLFPLLLHFVLRCLEQLINLAEARHRQIDDMRRSFMFYVLLALLLIVAVPSWMQFVQDFSMHPFL